MRRAGWSYRDIIRSLSVSKSTLSLWLRDIPYQPNKTVLKRVNDALMKTVMARHQVKLNSLSEAKTWAAQQFANFTQRDLMMVGLGLYIGEGSKRDEVIHLMNSDPAVLNLAVRWIVDILGVPLQNLRVVVHIYPDNSEQEAKKFWSKSTGIPLHQFGKTQVDRRTNKSLAKHGILPYGTAHIKVRSYGDPNLGKLLHRKVMALIEEIYKKQTRVSYNGSTIAFQAISAGPTPATRSKTKNHAIE